MEGKGKGFLLFLLLAALAFGGYAFYDYYRVEAVEVLSEGRYSEDEVKAMVLHGFAAKNSFLAQRLLTQEGIEDIPFVESLTVTSLSRNKIAIIVIEKKPVGCLSYLGNYVYFDRNGVFIEGEREREDYIPFFSTLEVDNVIRGERLDIKGRATILNAAVNFSSFMAKNKMQVDSVEFDENYHFYFNTDKIRVNLGTTDLLDEKLNRVYAILPKLEGRSGVLHAEIVTENNKNLTFEYLNASEKEYTGGYEADGEFTGEGYYDKEGKYVGPNVNWSKVDGTLPTGDEEAKEGEEPGEGQNLTPTPRPERFQEDEEVEEDVNDEDEEDDEEDEAEEDEDDEDEEEEEAEEDEEEDVEDEEEEDVEYDEEYGDEEYDEYSEDEEEYYYEEDYYEYEDGEGEYYEYEDEEW